jgi:hypothetical protein
VWLTPLIPTRALQFHRTPSSRLAQPHHCMHNLLLSRPKWFYTLPQTPHHLPPSYMLAKTKSKVCNHIHSHALALTHALDEELIKHGWEEDVWFHVDNLSSAHIYVRLPEGEDWEKMTAELLVDCAQLTKANSIEGTSMCIFWRGQGTD